MIGRTVSQYRILEQIGGGGMGLVYRAEDTRLKRQVALKFLPPELSRDPDMKERFMQEAQAASALQDNNICTIHEIDESEDGQLFLVMDLYEGKTLKEKLAGGPLPVGEALDIAIQAARGLVAAHARGIFHRDIKPANLLLTSGGTVKIVDFGLAKLAGQAMLTRSGTTLGTAPYMSVEQTRGEESDQRSDIWSLGVVLFQMLSGRLPFGGDHEHAVIYNIQNVDPPPIDTLRAGLPAGCAVIVAKALRKDAAARYQTMKEMHDDLVALQSGAPRASRLLRIAVPAALGALVIAGALYALLGRGPAGASRLEAGTPELRRLAVLPFTNLRSDPSTDFLGFALADQIIGQLAYVRTILVRPSMAVRQYQNQNVDPAGAAKALNVDFVLTGNYLRESDIVRLSLELVDVRANAIIWHDAIEESYVNAFKLEDLVSAKVVNGLRVQFSQDEARHMQADVPRNPKAYELFLKGVSSPSTVEGNRESFSFFRSSLALDSTYAPAFEELAFRLHQNASYAAGEQSEIRAAEQAYQKALSLNPGLLSAIAGLSSLYTDIGKTAEAFELSRRAIEVNPNSAENHFFLGYVYRYVGMMDDAVREMEHAVALDPGNSRFRSIGVTYAYRGEYDKALKGFDLDPESAFSKTWKAQVYALMGDTAHALSYCERVIATEPHAVHGLWARALAASLRGDMNEARSVLAEREKIVAVDGEQWYNLAQGEALVGSTAKCALALRKAIDGGFFCTPLMRRDVYLDPIRNDPVIRDLLAQAAQKHQEFIRRFNLSDEAR